MQDFLSIHPEVAAALKAGKAVVALESTVISHGLPYPANVETANALEAAIRAEGAVPATIAVLDGRIRVGLEADDIERLAQPGVRKVSRRDLPVALAQAADGATTVAATMVPPWPAFRFSPRAASAACIAGWKPPWTSPPI